MNMAEGMLTPAGVVKRIIYTATVLHNGWEMDNEAWFVELQDGTTAALTTSHCRICVAEREELQAKLQETEDSAASIRKLLELMV